MRQKRTEQDRRVNILLHDMDALEKKAASVIEQVPRRNRSRFVAEAIVALAESRANGGLTDGQIERLMDALAERVGMKPAPQPAKPNIPVPEPGKRRRGRPRKNPCPEPKVSEKTERMVPAAALSAPESGKTPAQQEVDAAMMESMLRLLGN